MSTLAVYFEQEGISTVVISLTRLHTEKIRPPRALWVPFELGRPFGPPGDAEFQARVLSTALSLLDHPGPGPVLVDFDEEDPNASADEAWTPPLGAKGESIRDELSTLDSSWHKSRQRFGNTAVGLAGLPLSVVVEFLERYDTEHPMPLPDYAANDGLSNLLRMRFCADDLRAFYSEAACAIGDPSSDQVWRWFWNDTAAGDLLRTMRTSSLASDDEKRQRIGGLFIVPRAYLDPI